MDLLVYCVVVGKGVIDVLCLAKYLPLAGCYDEARVFAILQISRKMQFPLGGNCWQQ